MIILRVIGLLYLCSGIWCALFTELSAEFLGIQLINELGKAEFFSVYGGLQVGLGLAMLLISLKSDYIDAAIYFCAIFSSSLFVFRLISLGFYSHDSTLVSMLIIEGGITVILWWKHLTRELLLTAPTDEGG